MIGSLVADIILMKGSVNICNMSIKKIGGLAESELMNELRIKLEAVLATQTQKNIPFVYRDKFCKKVNQFVHKYPNGDKYLIEQDQTDSTEIILRKF